MSEALRKRCEWDAAKGMRKSRAEDAMYLCAYLRPDRPSYDRADSVPSRLAALVSEVSVKSAETDRHYGTP